MSMMMSNDEMQNAKIFDLVLREREMSLSPREWAHRLAGYGYRIKETAEGQVVESLTHKIEIGLLPMETADPAHS